MSLYIIFIYTGFLMQYLDIIVVISFLSGIFTIISKNPIVSVLYLILLFSNIACYLIFVGITFIGISYLLVYVGAVSILFLFILMLINIRVSELVSNSSNNIPLGIVAIATFFIPFSTLLPNNNIVKPSVIFAYVQNDSLSHVSSNDWDGTIINIDDITSIGNIMYTNYSLWLIQTSIILLVAMIGSILITIKQKYFVYVFSLVQW
jgi:NADH-ubiquinone oxidoreductase chain 6